MSEADEVELPSLPRGSLTKMLTMAEDLTRTFGYRMGQEITEHVVSRWASEASMAADFPGPMNNYIETFRQYLGRVITPELTRVLGMQVAARADELRKAPLVAFVQPIRSEWVACEILASEPTAWRDDQSGTLFSMLALSGHPAGHILRRKFPDKWLNFFAYQVGFSRRIQYDGDRRHFIGLRFWGFMQPVPDSPEINFSGWEMSPYFRKANYLIIKRRTRFERDEDEPESRYACPNQYQHQCFDCKATRSECPASSLQTHRSQSGIQPTLTG